jgi:NAD-dependent deacetylase
VVPFEISEELRARLTGSGAITVLTGAGISAESGLATFRGPEGLWEGRDPMELATPEAFGRDPETVWRFYGWRRRQAARAEPNAAHRALAAWEAARPDLTLITQNVDGLHERAGNRSVIRLHGTLWRLRCVADGRESDDRDPAIGDPLPRCVCGALLRPCVVWFGEALPREAMATAERAVRDAAVLLVVGTSSLVYPAAALPQVGRAAGAYVVEVNPQPTALTAAVDEHLAGPAGTVVPALAASAGVALEDGG